ncbi:NMCC_0638 family (lipo)protein [Pseudomonas sp. RT6P73]
MHQEPAKSGSAPRKTQADSWSVPDTYGAFVLALPNGKNFCAVHVRNLNTAMASYRVENC